ncbi:hypothetical protein UFOVP1290_208 [uncultured Caudovirales phage]|uniref:Uncharacterized protein n=1 Tax=uncultured Caudovirales phage TaxID=2100421 RepID=A0A6J5RSR8_9CAUD|nr:hypothetical protein UFOVP1290_208 [uncultured Caudovirales phage]
MKLSKRQIHNLKLAVRMYTDQVLPDILGGIEPLYEGELNDLYKLRALFRGKKKVIVKDK